MVGTPVVGADGAQGITASTAVLSAKVNPRNLPAEAWFEYWPAASPQSATHTPAKTIEAAVTQKGLTASIAGLTPETQYAFRVAATNELAPGPVQSSVLGLRTEPGPGIPPPVAGQSVNIDTANGVVRVKCPGDSDFRTISAAEQIPVGCELDTDSGTVALTASKGSSGITESAYFWGGTFEIDQSPGDEQEAVATLGGRLRCEKRGDSETRHRQPPWRRPQAMGRGQWQLQDGRQLRLGERARHDLGGDRPLRPLLCLRSQGRQGQGPGLHQGDQSIITPGKRYVAKAPFLRLR